MRIADKNEIFARYRIQSPRYCAAMAKVGREPDAAGGPNG
jgi:hypothetical protein